jgi:general secretion pathway protein M
MSGSIFPRITQWLAGLAPRERLALKLMVGVLALASAWSLGVAPAWRTLRDSPARQAELDRQWRTMRALAAQAQTLQARQASLPKTADQLRALASANQRHLGLTGTPQTQSGQATVVLQAVPAAALAAWLEDVRINAHLVPNEVQLNRASAAGPATWSGTVVLAGLGDPAP